MPLRLYNTFTKKEQDFVPKNPKRVTMYTCGPTVYGRPHIGNYSAFLMADLLRRWLEAGHNYHVEYVKNITDVGHLVHDSDAGDDKVQKQAEQEKVHPLEIAKRYTDMYLEDEKMLNFLPLEEKNRPRASNYIKEMIAIINTLTEKGFTYETEDGIYFDVVKFPQYGALSGNTLDALNAGARIQVDENKHHPADFALWKKCVENNAKHVLRWKFSSGEISHTNGEDSESGFPGWHIECSAMSSALLGETIDIHTGGEDNIFPHHECEIAQSECAFGVHPFVNVWLHRRRIDLAGEKMSKSLGNVLSIPNIIEKGYSPMDLRYYFLSVHYRTNLKFDWKGMDDAHKARIKIIDWMDGISSWKPSDEEDADGTRISMKEFQEKFSAAMDSDLNVSAALAVVFDCMTATRKHNYLDVFEDVEKFIDLIKQTFGCFNPEQEQAIPEEVQQLADARVQARAEKNFAESDRLRDAIADMGYEVRDGSEGQTVKKK